MKEENKFIMILKMIISRFKKRDEAEKKRRSNEAKREMCKRAVHGNVCPHTCKICSWNVD